MFKSQRHFFSLGKTEMALTEEHLSGRKPFWKKQTNYHIIILEGLSFLRVLKLMQSSNTHRLLFDRSSSALTTLLLVKGFGTQTNYEAIRSFRLFRVLKLFYALNEFIFVCKFTSFCRFRDEVRQNKILITNKV